MRWRTFEIQREPGFRLNLIDLFLIVALVAASVAWSIVFPYQYLFLLPIYVGGSFFLFCNVFRIGNRMEMPWYVTFVVITVYGFSQSEWSNGLSSSIESSVDPMTARSAASSSGSVPCLVTIMNEPARFFGGPCIQKTGVLFRLSCG